MTDNQLVEITQQSGLEPSKTEILLSKFGDLFNDAKQTAQFAKQIKVTSVDQVEEMTNARKTRLELKNTRVEVERVRKELKEQSLREGKAIDGIANVIKALIVPVEEYLEEQEQFVIRIEAQKKLDIERSRVEELRPFVENVEVFSLHPDQITVEAYDQLLKSSKFAFEAQKKAEAEAEKQRLAQEKADREEQERIRKENAKLKAEAEAREKALAKERAEQQKILDDERRAREEIEAKIKAEKEAQEAKLKAEAEMEKKRLLAPDKEKLIEYAKAITANYKPMFSSKEAVDIFEETEAKLSQLAKEVEIKANNL